MQGLAACLTLHQRLRHLPVNVTLVLIWYTGTLLIVSAMIRLDLSQELEYPKPHQQKAKEAINFADLQKEIQEMQEVCKQLRAPVVFSHNDLLSGNVMIPPEVLLTVPVHICISCMSSCALQELLLHGSVLRQTVTLADCIGCRLSN